LLKPAFQSYPDIGKNVAKYQESCRLDDQLPVDVERLFDIILKINIIPIPSLFKSHEIDAFISNDFKKIYVDEYLYVNLEPQYRFTLAHELGHMVLHKSFYRQYGITDIASYHRYVNSITEDEYALLETQANNFAGLFLVPPGPLETHFQEQAKEIVHFISVKFKGLKREKYIGMAVELIARKLSPIFNVHYQPIQIRIERDKLSDLIP
jgi:Zn-dependent peptidase ImmA (M78 family)